MRIFRCQTPAESTRIARSGRIAARPVQVGTYDDCGQHVWQEENRVYFCTDPEAAQRIKAAFEYHRGPGWEIREYDAEVTNPQPDPKAAGGCWFTRRDIIITTADPVEAGARGMMSIEISKSDGRIVVSDGIRTYSRDASEPAMNQFGYEMDFSIGQAYEAGTLYVQDDDVDGDSHGQHGALYADSL